MTSELSSEDEEMTLAVDFDQTVTQDKFYDPYPPLGEERPHEAMIRWVNSQAQDHEIIIHTARSEELREKTEEWLEEYEVEYDELVMEKISADAYIDDKAFSPREARQNGLQRSSPRNGADWVKESIVKSLRDSDASWVSSGNFAAIKNEDGSIDIYTHEESLSPKEVENYD